MNDDTIICRCEEVRLGEIQEAIRLGLTSPGEIRKYTRAGMGTCQGRTCRHLLLQILRQAGGENCPQDLLPVVRPPLQSAGVGEISLLEFSESALEGCKQQSLPGKIP
jgi:bacterioferritin-associated ferredoxin